MGVLVTEDVKAKAKAYDESKGGELGWILFKELGPIFYEFTNFSSCSPLTSMSFPTRVTISFEWYGININSKSNHNAWEPNNQDAFSVIVRDTLTHSKPLGD